jgi:ATP-dependent Lon protease
MYRIKTKGYEIKEKMIIANKYLLPKIRKQVNFNEEDIILPDDTLQYIISDKRFSQGEAGVRNLKRCLEIVYTKLNLYRLVNKDADILEKEMNLKITFPHTVSRTDVDALIKYDETANQSLLSMYI